MAARDCRIQNGLCRKLGGAGNERTTIVAMTQAASSKKPATIVSRFPDTTRAAAKFHRRRDLQNLQLLSVVLMSRRNAGRIVTRDDGEL
jgi:hypothetical protein